MPDTASSTLLITGCSSGIGLASARMASERGWRVLATCRKPADCARLAEQGFESFVLDYEEPATIAAAASETLDRTGGRLDALFNNGAYAVPGAVEDVPTDALRANFEANLFGWHDLTRRLIPVMRRQGSGRIVQCSSVLGFVALPMRGSYNATKYALEGLTDTMRIELRGTGIHVALIEPGPIATRFGINAQEQFRRWMDSPEESAFRDVYEDWRLRPAETRPDSPHTLPPEAVAKKLMHAIESPSPRARYYVTYPTYLMGALRRLLPTRALDRVLANR